MNKRYKLLLKKLLLCSLLAGSSLTMCRLQARGAINAQDSLEKQLDHAIDHGKLAEIKNILTQQPELINTQTLGIHRETPLIRAVSQPAPKTQSDKDIFDYLLNFNNINVNMLDINGFSALDLALISFVDENRSEISRQMCKELMKKGAQVNKNYEEKALEEIKEEVRLEERQTPQEAEPIKKASTKKSITFNEAIQTSDNQPTKVYDPTAAPAKGILKKPTEPQTQSDSKLEEQKEIEECSICMENIEAENHDRAQLTCNHTFHGSCIDSWFKAQSDKNIHKTCPLCRKDFHNEDPFKAEPSTNEVSTLDVAQITEQLEKQKAELAQLEQEQSKEEKELIKTEAKLEEVKILPIEPIAPIKKKRARHKQKIAQKNDAIAVCKREIYLLEQAKLKAARRAAAQEAAAQPKKKATVQDFYGVKKSPKRKSRIRGGRAARRGPARKKSSKRQTAGKKSNKHNAKRKHSMKRKSAKRKQAQQAAE